MAGVAALLLAPVASAQEPTRPRQRDRDDEPARVFTWNDNRGRIGVVVDTRPDASTDRLGARIEAVTPGAPADRAGLKAGDIITKFNGTSLGGVRGEEEDQSGPGMKLLELARALEPGDTVRLEYRRGNDTKTATVVAQDLGWSGFARIPMPGLQGRIEIPDVRVFTEPGELMGRGALEAVTIAGLGSPWGNLEMVTLDPDLGEYFGVREGILVVKAKGDTTLPLKSGDVILAIDGRAPTSVSHALRILRSYEAGEQVKIDVQRKQRRQTITWTVPESRMRTRVAPTPRRQSSPAREPRPERSET
jgi:hypothetical protein